MYKLIIVSYIAISHLKGLTRENYGIEWSRQMHRILNTKINYNNEYVGRETKNDQY
jgi:hypothetical protein